MFSSWTNTKLVFSKYSEDIVLELDQTGSFVCGLLHSGGQSVPDLTISSSPFNNIVGNFGATIITWRVPSQKAGLIGDFRNVKSSRGTRLICFEEQI